MKRMDFPSLKQQNGPVESYKLPIIDQRAEILDTIRANQVVLLSGPTGCGKSTQVPQFILDQHAGLRKPVNILVTQPRKIAASSVARRVCKERGWMLGGLVGYQVINYKLKIHRKEWTVGTCSRDSWTSLIFVLGHLVTIRCHNRWGWIRRIERRRPSFSMWPLVSWRQAIMMSNVYFKQSF